MFRPISAPKARIDKIELELSETVKLDAFADEFVKVFNGSVKKIAYEAKEFWQAEAGRRLKSSREAYQKSLTVQEDGPHGASVSLGGGKGGTASRREKWLALAIEQGAPMFDMKPGLLQGAQSRVIRLSNNEFRTVKADAYAKWIHPGFMGMNIQEVVVHEINAKLVPKYMKAAFEAAKKVL